MKKSHAEDRVRKWKCEYTHTHTLDGQKAARMEGITDKRCEKRSERWIGENIYIKGNNSMKKTIGEKANEWANDVCQQRAEVTPEYAKEADDQRVGRDMATIGDDDWNGWKKKSKIKIQVIEKETDSVLEDKGRSGHRERWMKEKAPNSGRLGKQFW